MTPRDLRQRLNLTPSTFYRHQKAGVFRRFEVKHPIGVRRYSPVLVGAFLDGKTVTFHGRRVTA